MSPTPPELAFPDSIPDDLFASGSVIQHPRFRALHARISECLEATAEDGEPQCLCLIGETGVGKTTLARTYAAAFPRHETPLGARTPILYLETPHPITVKGMTSALLHALGDPRAFKGTQPEMNARLQGFLADCGTRLVILDDFHHLIDKQTNHILRDVSEWLKVLIKNTGIVYLVVGIEGEVERILTANPQLSRLFVRERLRPFSLETSRPGDGARFCPSHQLCPGHVGRDFVRAGTAAGDAVSHSPGYWRRHEPHHEFVSPGQTHPAPSGGGAPATNIGYSGSCLRRAAAAGHGAA